MVQAINSILNDRESFIKKLQAAGITQEELQSAKSQGDSAFKALLEAHGIQPPAPPSREGGKDRMIQQLKALGIPDDIIKQGPEAVKKYAEEHNITLPEPPKKMHGKENNSSQRMNFQSKVEEYMQQHQEVTETEAIQAVMEEIKAKHTAQQLQNKTSM